MCICKMLLFLFVGLVYSSCVPSNDCTLSLVLTQYPVCMPASMVNYNDSYLNSLSNNTFVLISSGCANFSGESRSTNLSPKKN